MGGGVAFRFAENLIRPLFSAMKTRPSLAKRTAVGVSSPLKMIDSLKPAGSVGELASCALLAWHSPSVAGGCGPKRGGGQLGGGAASACDATSDLAPLNPPA